MTPHFGKERFSAKKGKKHKMQCLMQAEQPQEENLQDFVVKGRTERAPPPSQSVQDKKGVPSSPPMARLPTTSKSRNSRRTGKDSKSKGNVHPYGTFCDRHKRKVVDQRHREQRARDWMHLLSQKCNWLFKNPSSIQEQGSPHRKLPRQRNQFCERKNGEHPSCTRDFRNAVLW